MMCIVNKILIASLTRMGDLLQATPLMAGLRKKHPGARLDVLVSSDFASIAKSIPNINEVRIFNLRQFTPAECEGELTLVKVYQYIEGFVEELKKSKYDVVINLSHSKMSAVMTSLINVKDIRGITSSNVGNRMIKHPWLKYFATILFNRDYNSFNLVDIYLKSGDVEASEDQLLLEVDEESKKFSEEFLSQQGVKENDFLVGFQPGSSRKGRRWSTKSFADLGDRIVCELKGKVILFGVKSESDLGQEIEEMMENKPVNAMGKTSVQHLSGLVRRCNVLITNDTGTMHIATAMGTRVVGLFFAHALPMETGPYSRGNIVFQANIPCSPCSYGVDCNNVVCVDYVTVDQLFQVLKLIKDEKIDGTFFENDSGMEKIKMFRSDFDEDHMLEFLPMIKRSITKQDFFYCVHRLVWKITLGLNDGKRTKHFKDSVDEKAILKKLKTHYSLNGFSGIYPDLKESLEEFNKLWEISKQASRITENLVQVSNSNPPQIQKIKTLGEKIVDLDEKVSLMGHTNPVIKPITDMFRFGKENLQGDDVSALAKETLILYQNMKCHAGNIYQIGTQLCESLKQSFDTSINLQ